MERNIIFAVLGLSTSGKGIRNNRIIDICIVRMEDGVMVEKLESLINPEQHIPGYITERTGIDDETVHDAPTFYELAQEIDRLTQNAIMVGHQVSFLYHVLRSEFQYLNQPFERPKLCAERLCKKLIPNLFSYDLEKLCSSLGIPYISGHLAKRNTDAVLIIFKRLLTLDDTFQVMDAMLAPKPAVMRLPSHMGDEQLTRLPDKAGVYSFQDNGGKVLYVGKAKNIKKRVLGHFQSKTEKENILCNATFSIDFELTGSELIALLLEADSIQRLLPKYNTVQKKSRTAFHIKAYPNSMGILQLAVEEHPALHEPTELFFTKGAAKARLEMLCEKFNLCPKFTGLQRKKGRCKHLKFPDCLGVCCGQEEIHVYNDRAQQAMASLRRETDSFIISEKGRTSGEQGFVLVLGGVYKGFGFVDGGQQISSIEEMMDVVQPRKQTYHTLQIIRGYRKKYPHHCTLLKLQDAHHFG